jgi:hypothetical protein
MIFVLGLVVWLFLGVEVTLAVVICCPRVAPLFVGLLWLTKCFLGDPFIGLPVALDVEIK